MPGDQYAGAGNGSRGRNDKWALRQKINPQWNKLLDRALEPVSNKKGITMRGALLWLIGIPIPIIILLYLFNVF